MRQSYAFRVAGIAPRDAAYRTAGEAVHRQFWAAVVKLVLRAKDRELAAGLDRFGVSMVPIAESTRRKGRWRSHTGMGDPDAPPLDPAYALSRTRSLLTGRAHRDHAEFFWRLDTVTGQHWGRILGFHRAGAGRLPVRDVIGLSPQSLAWVREQAAKWWADWKAGREHARRAEQTRVVLPARAKAARPVPERPRPAAVPSFRYATFGIGGSEAQVRRAAATGRLSGPKRLGG